MLSTFWHCEIQTPTAQLTCPSIASLLSYPSHVRAYSYSWCPDNASPSWWIPSPTCRCMAYWEWNWTHISWSYCCVQNRSDTSYLMTYLLLLFGFPSHHKPALPFSLSYTLLYLSFTATAHTGVLTHPHMKIEKGVPNAFICLCVPLHTISIAYRVNVVNLQNGCQPEKKRSWL